MGSAEVQRVNTTQRLRVLRELMVQEKHHVNALIVPSEDQRALRYKMIIFGHHPLLSGFSDSSEYLADCDKRRAFISGFDGSAGIIIQPFAFKSAQLNAGCAVVTKEHAYLFTDGRYFLQAEQQLDK